METKYLLYVTSSFLWFVLFKLVLLPKAWSLTKIYKNIPDDKKMQWCMSCASSLHASIVTAAAIYFVWFECAGVSDLLWVKNTTSDLNICFTLGFMLSDLLMMSIYKEQVGSDLMFFIHHSVSIIGYLICLVNGYLIFQCMFRLMSEFSTTFVNIRWMLSACEMKHTKLYFWNGFTMMSSFFLCRILLAPIFWLRAYQMINTEIYKITIGPVMHWTWISICLTLDTFNCVWMLKMLKYVITQSMSKKKV